MTEKIQRPITSNTDLSTEKSLTEEQEIYKENIIDHYKHPHNKSKMENPTITKEGINPLCGDHITIYLKLETNGSNYSVESKNLENFKNAKVVDVSFEGEGCAISLSSISMLTDLVKGKTIGEIKNISEKEIYEMLGIPISHTRRKCALLSIKTMHQALEKQETKNQE